MQLREPFGDETAVTDEFEAPPGEGRPGPAAATGPASSDAASSEDAAPVLRLHRWFDRAIVAVALIALFSGFGQFSVVAALGDVSKQLGHVAPGASIADKVGLSGTSLGIGLAIIRLASLGSLPLIGIADRFGRRRMILVVTVAGLAFTAVAALSPDYWWFVVVFAFGRPLLSATNTLAGVMAAEETGATDRAAAVALIAAGYGVGAGISAIVHSLSSGALGFRGVFALAVVPLVVVVAMRGWLEEPSRFMIQEAATEHPTPVLAAVEAPYGRRVLVLALIAFALSVITGPANSFVFLYAQDVLHQPGGWTALMVVGAGVSGLAGLLLGRWLADRVGRRPACAASLVAAALCGTIAYSGGSPALVVGYLLRSVQRRRARSRRGLVVDRALPDLGARLGCGMVDGGGRARRRRRTGGLRRSGGRRQPLRRSGCTDVLAGHARSRALLVPPRDAGH